MCPQTQKPYNSKEKGESACRGDQIDDECLSKSSAFSPSDPKCMSLIQLEKNILLEEPNAALRKRLRGGFSVFVVPEIQMPRFGLTQCAVSIKVGKVGDVGPPS